MTRNKNIYLILLCVFLLYSCSNNRTEIGDEGYVAFSLKEAQHRLINNSADSNLYNLGGITRIVGMIIDRKNWDIILIGKKAYNMPKARLDDFVVALRARMKYDEIPMVSIDPIPSSYKTGMQQVRFCGHIEETSFGKDFLDSDILLKEYSLELAKQIDGIESYRKLYLDNKLSRLNTSAENIKDVKWSAESLMDGFLGKGVESENNTQSRFWFIYKNPIGIRTRGNVYCIMALDIIVEREITNIGTSIKEKKKEEVPGVNLPDEQYARIFTDNFYTISNSYPSLKRMKLLFDMCAIAEGLKNTKDIPDISFLLDNYPVKVVNTQKEYRLIKQCAAIKQSNGKTSLVQLSGGIETSIEMQWLNGGDVAQLENIVLKSRPKSNSLFWNLPLDKWEMPNNKGIMFRKKSESAKSKSGCSIITNSVVLTSKPEKNSQVFNGFSPITKTADKIGTKGVQMKMIIDTSSFKKENKLKSLSDSIMRSRNMIE